MAKFQWTAASETLGQPPSLLTNVCDGTINDWEIVADASAYGGQALKLINAVSARRRLYLGVDAPSAQRIDVRARAYKASNGSTGAHTIVLFNNGTTASDSSDYFPYWGSDRQLRLAGYVGGSFGESFPAGAVGPVPSGQIVGWWNWRVTYQPVGQSPRLRVALWRDDSGSEESPLYYFTSDTPLDSFVTDPGYVRLCIGTSTTVEVGAMFDWITIGTDGDDADVAPSGGGPATHELEGAATASVSAGADLTTAPANAVKGVREQLGDGTTPGANLTGLSVRWWDNETATGLPDYEADDGTTDASGWLEVDLDAVTTLDLDDYGYLLVLKNGASTADDIVAAGRVKIKDIAS